MKSKKNSKKKRENNNQSKIKNQKRKKSKILIFYEGVDEHKVNIVSNITNSLLQWFGIPAEVKVKGKIWETPDELDEIYKNLVRIRVIRWNEFKLHEYVAPAEISFERKKAEGKIKGWGILYDGFFLQSIMLSALLHQKLIEKIDLEFIPVIITDRQIATFGEDGRYHLRIAVLGYPSLISEKGFFSAPAKPKEYHISKMISEDVAIVKGYSIQEEIENKFPLLARPYIILSLLWTRYGIGFCQNETCFFSDSHTTESLLKSKSGKITLCNYHKDEISKIKEKIKD
jgi:hypothetical protein